MYPPPQEYLACKFVHRHRGYAAVGILAIAGAFMVANVIVFANADTLIQRWIASDQPTHDASAWADDSQRVSAATSLGDSDDSEAEDLSEQSANQGGSHSLALATQTDNDNAAQQNGLATSESTQVAQAGLPAQAGQADAGQLTPLEATPLTGLTVNVSWLTEQLNSLRSDLFLQLDETAVELGTSMAQMASPALTFSGPAATTPASTAMVAQSSRIDQLTGTALSNITVNGVSGLTAADIPTNIVAGNYLPLAGGALTGALTGTDLTLSGSLTVVGAQTLSGALTVPYITATSTSEASTFAYRVGIGTTSPFAKLSVTGAGTGTGKAFQIADSNDTPRVTVQDDGKVGIGTTTPEKKLHLVGDHMWVTDAETDSGVLRVGAAWSRPGIVALGPGGSVQGGKGLQLDGAIDSSDLATAEAVRVSTIGYLDGSKVGTWRTRFTIFGDGRVGIGTNMTSASGHVHIRGDTLTPSPGVAVPALVVAWQVQNCGEVNIEKLLGDGARPLVIEAPAHAVGENSPAQLAGGEIVYAAQIAQHLG